MLGGYWDTIPTRVDLKAFRDKDGEIHEEHKFTPLMMAVMFGPKVRYKHTCKHRHICTNAFNIFTIGMPAYMYPRKTSKSS